MKRVMESIKKIRLQFRLLMGLVIMVTILSTTVLYMVIRNIQTQVGYGYFEYGGMASVAVASFMNGDQIEQYYETGEKDQHYEQIQRELQNIREKMHLQFIYVVVPEDDSMTYIWTAEDEDFQSLGSKDEAILYEALQDSLTSKDPVYWKCSQTSMGGATAILNSEGTPVAVVCVGLSLNEVRRMFHLCIDTLREELILVLLFFVAAFYGYLHCIFLRPLRKLHSAVVKLVDGEMKSPEEFQPDIHTGDEIEELASTFQYMVSELKEYIRNLKCVTAEQERIRAELNLARSIQASELPSHFPAFPARRDFDIYASMSPAKEVSGDFYDFFLIDEDHLALVMADVSGKGVPAALFMMVSKSLLKAATQSGLTPGKVLERVNNELCENNKEEMFVTVWLGILEISTGKLKCANAGHEYPAIMRKGGRFELFRDKHGFVLAGMEGMRYQEYELVLNAGDRLVVYTDGVPEAMNADQELYGTDRMIHALTAAGGVSCRELLESLEQDVKNFTGEAEQFDDITMLAVEISPEAGKMGQDEEWNGNLHTEDVRTSGATQNKKMDTKVKECRVVPSLEQLSTVMEFYDRILHAAEIPERMLSQIDVAIEEIYVNIAHYSEATEAVMTCALQGNKVILNFYDNGKPFDPTQKADPDTTLSVEERKIGGLGIFMVKKLMDEMIYERKDGWNVLTLVKNSGE